jgi:hypothetical protein
MDVRRIFTHSGKAHADEFLACSVLLKKYPNATVLRVDELPAELGEYDVAVDIGRTYTPMKVLDHHHDLNVPCSLVLVLKDFYGYDYGELPLSIRAVDMRDRYGPQKTAELTAPSLVETAVLQIFSNTAQISPGDPLHLLLIHVGESVLEEADGLREARKVKLFMTPKGYVAFASKPIATRHLNEVYENIIGAVMPDSRSDGKRTVVYRVGRSPFFDPARIPLRKSYEHPGGFLVVVDAPFDQVAPDIVTSYCVVNSVPRNAGHRPALPTVSEEPGNPREQVRQAEPQP